MYVKILDSEKEFQRKVYAALAFNANKQAKKNFPKLEGRVRQIVAEEMAKSPFLRDLVGPSDLRGELGLYAGSEGRVAKDIINAVSESTQVTFRPWNDSLLNGGVTVNVQPANMLNLLGLTSAVIRTSSENLGSYELDWLDWVLKRGDQIIVSDFDFNPETGLGRSRIGNMRNQTGVTWRVPPEHAGVIDNNFITKALATNDIKVRINGALILVLTG